MEEKIAHEVNTSEIDVEQGEMQQPVQTKKRMNITNLLRFCYKSLTKLVFLYIFI